MIRRFLAFLSVAALGPSSYAASWQVIPLVSAEGVYETNAGLNSEGEEDGYSAVVEAELEARRETERTAIFIAPSVEVARFIQDEDLQELDRESYFVNAGVDHELERSMVGISGRFSRQPTYRSELDPTIPADIDNPLPSSGGALTIRDDEQTRWTISPYWRYRLTERDTVGLSAYYTDVQYEETGTLSPRFDYDDVGVTAEWDRAMTPRSGVVLDVSASDYQADRERASSENSAQTQSASLGYRWDASETSTLRMSIGVTQTEQELSGRNFCTDPADVLAGIACEVKFDDTSVNGDVRWRVTGLRNTGLLMLSRGVQPSSNGRQQNRTMVRGLVSRSLTSRATGTLALVASRQDGLDDESSFERDYLSAEAEVAWQLARQWSLTAGYRYLSRESSSDIGDGEDFSDNQVRLGITWQGLRR